MEIPQGDVGACGYSPALLYQMNQQANGQRGEDSISRSQAGGPPPGTASVFTQQGNFPLGQVVTCGKFRLYYEDFLQGPAGFNDSTTGPARRATLCAVLNYVENTLNINVNGTTNFIDLYIAQSWSTSNPAPPSVGYLAVAGPYFNPASGYGTTPGYYAGNVLLHATDPFGADPQLGKYDGTILVNFDQSFYNSVGSPISYWDDYLNTTASCRFDLFSVLLHEVTHALGFVSNVAEDANFDAVSGAPNNSFTKFDQLFLYYGSTACVPSSLTKVVTGTTPSINPAVRNQTNELRSNRIWLRNGPVEQNHPVYSGTLDPNYPLRVSSLASHMAGSILSFTAMSQFAPGFQPNYVMGPEIGIGQRKREWTLAELRTLLALGYALNGAFSSSTSLNGADPNAWLLLNNSPPYRTNCSQPMLSYNTPFNFMETLPADFAVLTNNNTPSAPTATQLTINVASLGVADAQGDAVRVMKNSLFGIRGVSGNANDHAALVVNTSGSQIVYTPEAGFHGRAQFGFYLWDGHERGGLRIVSIDVSPGSYTVTPGNELVINPGLEDGTEMRQRVFNPSVEHSSIVDWAYEGVFAGQNLSGGHPFNFITNWWNLAGGDVMENPWYACFMGPHPQNGYYGSATSDWNSTGFGGFQYPAPVATSGTNQRYHIFQGGRNYSTLINPVQGCNVYQFEADLSFEKSGLMVGEIFTFQLQFVNDPSPSFHTQLYYTVPVNVAIGTITHNTWQHVTFGFQYCGTPTYFMNLLVQGVLSSPPPVVSGTGGSSLSNTFVAANTGTFIDNISLKQVSPAPALTLATTGDPTGTCGGGSVTLSTVPVSYVPCNATYLWQPGNLSGNTVTVTPSVTTGYTVTASSMTCPQTSTSTVTAGVRPAPPAGLVDWWSFDETSGGTAQDIGGQFNNIGTHINGPTPIPGIVDGALSFDGVNDYVEVPDHPELNFLGGCVLDFAEPMTIDVWVRTHLPKVQLGPNSGLRTILDKRVNPGQPNGYSLFLFNGRLGFQMNGNNFVAPGAGPNYINIADNQWHFVAVSLQMCRGGGGFLYVDGQTVLSLPPGVGFANSSQLYIGRRAPVFGANFFRGALDELEIFKRGLTASDLLGIFAAGSQGKCKIDCSGNPSPCRN